MRPCKKRLTLILCLATGLSFSSSPALAHESRPFHINIVEIHEHAYRLHWNIPTSIPAFNLPEIWLPADCMASREPDAADNGPSYSGQTIYRCRFSLMGRELSVRFPEYNPSVSTMINITAAKGEKHFGLLGPDETVWRVPDAETKARIASLYTKIGIKHILTGFDHLLFLSCLIWIAGGVRRIIVTITGFTLAHCSTLALSALGLVAVPVAPVEAAIALSIVFLAREISLGRRKTLTWKHPIAVSSSFGLLHGFGFATVLGDIGLPQTELLTGLLFFNAGVEIGQIVFVSAVSAPIFLCRSLNLGASPSARFARPAVAYGVGILATYWLFQRVIA